MTPEQKAAIEALAYLERRVGDVLRGIPVRDLDEAFSGVRTAIERTISPPQVGEHGLEDVERVAEILRIEVGAPTVYCRQHAERILSVIRPASDELAAAREEIETLRKAAHSACFHWFECEHGDCGKLGGSMDALKAASGYDPCPADDDEIDERRITRDGENK